MPFSKTIITGSGSYIPSHIKTNKDFAVHNFYSENHERIEASPLEIVKKFELITGIRERRYAATDVNTSDMASIAANIAINDSGIDAETLDQIIVAHNFGDVFKHTNQTDAVPSLAARVKNNLGIKNPFCIPYDILFGCPGWVQGLIQTDSFFKAGTAKKILLIGAETLSRVIDMYDRDCMIFSDGAGACIVEAVGAADEQNANGILGVAAQSHCTDETFYIHLDKSNFPNSDPRIRYIKMKGRKVYEYALKHVPEAMKFCLDKSGVEIHQLKKIFIHQANEKMDEAIIENFYKLYNINVLPDNIMPMNIHELGNSSVATIPTLFDMVRKGVLPEHTLSKDDIIMFTSVGAGMNINAVCYKI